MVQATDLRNRDDFTDGLNGSWIRRILVERQVQPRTMVIIQIRSNRSPQGGFVENDHVIQAFAADRTDHTLNIRALPGRTRRTEDLSNVHGVELLLKGISINSIAITQQITRCSIVGKGFNDLLGGPFGAGVSRHVEVNDTAPVVADDDEDKQCLEEDRGHREEVYGNHLSHMIVEERSPGLRGWFPISEHVLADGSLGNVDGQFLKFAMDSRCRPKAGSHDSIFG